jgi:sec-independent protein translocase protein TatA
VAVVYLNFNCGGFMGLTGISPGSLLLIFLIVVVLFGTKKLQTVGEDLGKALKGFRKGMRESEDKE